ncbi:MAG: hypothetical protein V4591_00240 [Bdellovibrionota bacterium]
MLNIRNIAIFFAFFATACGYKTDAPSIENNVSFPGSLVALNSTHFLMLNTDANGDYSDGSIHQYTVDTSGQHSLLNVISVQAHGSELAVSSDSNLVALSYDGSVNPTQIQFYNYSDPLNPVPLNISLNFHAAGGKQVIKNLGFFSPTGGGNYYYLYGSIISYAQDDGSNGNIPTRAFVARVASDFSSANILFTLSYQTGDTNSLVFKSDSRLPYDYSFGSSSPTFDAAHNLFLAFPTGAVGGLNNSDITYPPYPSNIFNYFSGVPDANKITCSSGIISCSQPDMRTTSLFAVDMTAILNGDPLNNSVYFVPMAWNFNGVPYGATTNNVVLNKASFADSNSDLTSLNFQTSFWSAKWMNSPNLGNGSAQCYTTSNPTVAGNEYDLSSVGSNGLLVTKSSTSGASDLGLGNEVFQMTGLDILSSSINTIKTLRNGVNLAGEEDFGTIATAQILDPFNDHYDAIKSTWLNENSSPILPYMYSRTTGINAFGTTSATAAVDYGVLNFGSNNCLPYWVRDSVNGFVNWGMDSAWLSTSPVALTLGANSTFYNAVIDPTQPSLFTFPNASGAQRCTDVSPVANTPIVFCANFLSGKITHFTTTASGSVFTSY